MMLVVLEGIIMCFVLLIICVVGIANGPEDELVAGSFLINKVFNQWSVWFAELRPVAVAEGSVKVYGDDLICCQTHGGSPFFRLCIKPCFMCLSVLQFSGYVV